MGDRAESWRKAIEHFVDCMLWYAERGVTVFVLGCTEIPVVINEEVVRTNPRLAGQ